ncbi:RNA exonuclease 4 [Episyrphus balteatus]|uniref:RNA exonuclease 4 n=1 Tax=Episyrphus balteatus TaxID=286459 RepID=UPI002485493A|nr:RNA exonuclease 4 [Episyrphus balteatus]
MDIERQNKHKKSPRKPNENKSKTTTEEIRPNVKTKKPPLPIVVMQQQKPSLSRKNAGTNWSSVLAAINAAEGPITLPEAIEATRKTVSTSGLPSTQNQPKNNRKKQRYEIVAMDCEMVGVGPSGNDDMLARVSIVKKSGEVLMDKFVKPREPVTDYRTSVSGIRPRDIEHGEEFDKVQAEVIVLLQGKILVGHGIYNDLAVLHIKHPASNIRDTARYKPLARLVSNGRTPSLKRLSEAILGKEIQTGEHNSVEDARAAMSIYNRLSIDWEKYIEKKKRSHK